MAENNTNNQKQYINGVWISEKVFQDGGSILKLSILKDKFLESFNNAKPNEKGYVKLVISKSRTPKDDSSHYIYVDNWTPQEKSVASSAPSLVSEAVKPDAQTPEDSSNF